jgi:AcrR family transcriptional regulator
VTKQPDNAADSIVDAACAEIREAGLIGATVSGVASRCGVSSALIHYHFDTKERLLVGAVARLLEARAVAVAGALRAGRGLAALDALWEVLAARIANGDERACVEGVSAAGHGPAFAEVVGRGRSRLAAAVAARITGLLEELGCRSDVPADELAETVVAVLDGLALGGLAGRPPEALRSAYDAFWLTLVAAAPPARRR